MSSKIILIDESDHITGYSEKLQAHQEGKLHRAFSVFILNSKNELLIQQRSLQKYHSGGLWSNTCCGHFSTEENQEAQAEQRLMEEMGVKTNLMWIYNYSYKTQFENGLIENELVYAYLGLYDGNPSPDPQEAENWRWINIEKLITEMQHKPEEFTYWFKFAFDNFNKALTNRDIEE